eukprot:727880-Pleurochrysis_carterae.AAC.1
MPRRPRRNRRRSRGARAARAGARPPSERRTMAEGSWRRGSAALAVAARSECFASLTLGMLAVQPLPAG